VRRALGVYAVLIYAFVFAPIVFLVLFSFNANPAGSFPITGLTTRWYSEALDDFELKDAFWTSLEVAIQVTLVSVAVGTAAAFPLVRSRLRFRNAIRLAATLPIMLPGLLIGISLLILLGGVLHLPLSSRTAVVGQCIFTTPFVILLVAARLQLLDPKLEWAAGDLGANPRRRIVHVVLPALMPALIASALLAFTLSFDEFIITLFVIGGDQTLPLYVFNHVRYGITPAVNAVASVFLLGSFAVLTLALTLPSALRRVRLVGEGRLRGPVDIRRRMVRQHPPQQRH
jgi:spermidine/putrescine transport system permease protein